jgi:hypothetical protein
MRIGVSLDASATPNKGGCGKEGPVLIEETYKFSNGVDPRQLLMVSVGGPWPLGVVRPNDGFTTTVASPPTWESVFCTQANQTLRYQRVFINVSTGAMSKVMDVQVRT